MGSRNRAKRERARRLRRRETDAERKLWAHLRARQLLGAKFRRQHPVGPYFVDFCCVEHRLIVELDGGQHLEQLQGDLRRTLGLAKFGYRVLRFWDNEVLIQAEAVLQRIAQAISSPSPTPSPP